LVGPNIVMAHAKELAADDGVAAMRTLVAIARSVERGEAVKLGDVSGSV